MAEITKIQLKTKTSKNANGLWLKADKSCSCKLNTVDISLNTDWKRIEDISGTSFKVEDISDSATVYYHLSDTSPTAASTGTQYTAQVSQAFGKLLSEISLDRGEALVDTNTKSVIISTKESGKAAGEDVSIITLGASRTELGEASNNSITVTHKDAAGDSSYTLKTQGATLSRDETGIIINSTYILSIVPDTDNKCTTITLTSPDGTSVTGSIADPDWDTKVLNRPVVHWVGDAVSQASDVIASITNGKFSYKSGKSTSDLRHYDVCIHKQKIGDTDHYEHTVYIYYENKDWQRLDYEYDANKIIMPSDLQLAGDYTRVGNITKTDNQAVSSIPCKGMSVYATLDKIFNIREFPVITPPSYSFDPSYTTDTGDNEIGSYITSIGGSYTFTDGKYSRGKVDATGKFYTSTSADCTPSYSTSVNSPNYISTTSKLASPTIGIQSTTDNGGKGIQITSLTSTKYAELSTKCSWTDSAYFPADSQHNEYYDDKNNNNQKDADEGLNIKAGNSSKSIDINVQGIRYHFHGAKTSQDNVDSTYIRKCTPTTNSSFSISLTSSTKRVIIAAYGKSLGSVKDVNDSNSEISGSFSKNTIAVQGANSYTAVDYNVYTLDFAGNYGQNNTYNVTLV